MNIIKVENISKKYIISNVAQQTNYATLREAIVNTITHPFNVFKKKPKEEFWALKDIDFEIKQGDRLGIIGRNGAGKSTLLKILSRITEPTTGKITLSGRVASLLEVGTGFHPELTGRENVYLNGAILGMSRNEIKGKFDEIVDFSGVEKFLDTPVKRYSSGMYVRLAFAVAAHLEPEILLVDEVLAVGDAEFQKKCLGKMEDISKGEGRTILFVSHNMGAIQSLCNKGIFLQGGTLSYSGDIESCVNLYSSSSKNETDDISSYRQPGGSRKALFEKIEFVNEAGASIIPATGQENVRLRIHYKSNEPKLSRVKIAVTIHSTYDLLLQLDSDISSGEKQDCISGTNFFDCLFPKFPLTAGNYSISALLNESNDRMDFLKGYPFRVEDGSYFGKTQNCTTPAQLGRIVLIPYTWIFPE